MTKLAIKSAKRWLTMAAVAVIGLSASVSHAASSGIDNAGNYTSVTFTNGANLGTGFGEWQFNATPEDFIGLTNSTAGSGNINSGNGFSFTLFGGTNGSYAEVVRAFNAPLVVGDTFEATFAYNWSGGARGMNILDASNTELLNINYSESGGTNYLTYTVQGGSGIPITTDYLSTAAVDVVVAQLGGNALDITITRIDGITTNIVTGSLSSPAAKVKFYNGGHAGNDINYALFANDLIITESTVPSLSLSGRDAMAAGMTNDLLITRSGIVDTQSVVSISNSDSAAASTPASVTLESGDTVTNFPITGLDLGMTTIEITADGYPTSSLDVAVYDLGYDDSSYSAGSFTNGGNSGLGFQPWIFTGNDGPGDGYTNFSGAFIGNSTANGGGDVNASSGDAFGLYANQEGTGDAPYYNAIRLLDNELGVGEVVSLEFGVNFRNGSKGVAFQNSGSTIFEVGVFADNYWYVNNNTTNGPVNLGWDYAADSAIFVEIARISPTLYDITIIRDGSDPKTNVLDMANLGSTAINEVRAYIYGTEAGGENNLYFNSLALYSGEEVPTLTLDGNDGMVIEYTNLFSVTRSGATDAALTVMIGNSDANVVGVTNEVVLGIGVSNIMFDVVGLSNGITTISVDAAGAISDSLEVDVYDIAYDDTTYYPPATFDTNGNGGVGFQMWDISVNAGEGDGYTNFVGAFIGTSGSSAEINASDDEAFALYATKEGTGGDDPLAEATRSFAALEVGESITASIAVNYRNGAKGLMIQSGGTWLFEVGVYSDDYWYNIRNDGADNAVSLGWDYASDTTINVIISRTGASSYNVQISREGSSPEENLIEGITLSQVPDEIRFYNYFTDAGGDENNLYINFLAQFTGTVGGSFTDGIPDSWWNQYGVAPVDRVATNDLEPDGQTSWAEYIADTNPTNAASVLNNVITTFNGAGVMTLTIGPTTNSRVYDVWWNDNLLQVPQQWTRYGLNVVGDGTVLDLQVTNEVPNRSYRTGVTLP